METIGKVIYILIEIYRRSALQRGFEKLLQKISRILFFELTEFLNGLIKNLSSSNIKNFVEKILFFHRLKSVSHLAFVKEIKTSCIFR